MLLMPEDERELRERLDEPRLDEDDERPRPLVDEERRRVEDPFDDEPLDDEFAIVLYPGNISVDIVIRSARWLFGGAMRMSSFKVVHTRASVVPILRGGFLETRTYWAGPISFVSLEVLVDHEFRSNPQFRELPFDLTH